MQKHIMINFWQVKKFAPILRPGAPIWPGGVDLFAVGQEVSLLPISLGTTDPQTIQEWRVAIAGQWCKKGKK